MPPSLKALVFLLLPIVFLESCEDHTSTTSDIKFHDPERGIKIESITYLENSWQVVTMDPAEAKPAIRLSDSTGKPLRHFSAFKKSANAANESIIWMMNAGMYHKGGNPVGLCIIDGRQVTPVNKSDGKGNFFLKPNGIFLLTDQGAQIIPTSEWRSAISPTIRHATQSGPLLVDDGNFHPAIRKDSPNKHIRNGVGIRNDGHLCFVISTNPVTFHEMSLFLRDHLNCRDALYLDGAISALHAPVANLTSDAKNLGPVIGFWE